MPPPPGTPFWRVGVDLTSVRELEQSVGGLGDRFLDRVFTPQEVDASRSSGGPFAGSLAARFAAKEATIKALRPAGTHPPWREIEVYRLASGACELVLHGAAAALATAEGIEGWSLSLSHEGGMAIAVVLGWGWRPDADERLPADRA